MSTTNKNSRIAWFILRRIRWFRCALYIGIPLLLLLCGFLEFVQSINEPDSVLQSLTLNISAGFIGSFFTFIIIGLFEFLRSRISFLEMNVPQLTQTNTIDELIADHFKTVATLIEQVNRLYKIIDLESNLEQSREIINSQKQLADYSVEILEETVSLAEDRLEYVKSMLDQAIASQFKMLIDALRERYKFCKTDCDNAKSILDDHTKIQANLAQLQSKAAELQRS